VPKKFFPLSAADNIGLFVKKMVPLSATDIKINRLFNKCRIGGFQGQKGIVMPASFAFDPVSAGANNNIGQNSGSVIGVAEASIIRQFPDVCVGKISMHHRPQVLNLGETCRFRRDAIFGQ